MNKEEILAHLTALDFMSLDLALYCNTHPTDTEAISMYNKAVCEAAKLKCEYEKHYGPLVSFRSENDLKDNTKWHWICDPWPWQKQANFELRSDDNYVGV